MTWLVTWLSSAVSVASDITACPSLNEGSKIVWNCMELAKKTQNIYILSICSHALYCNVAFVVVKYVRLYVALVSHA